MTPELTYLAASVALFLVMIVVQAFGSITSQSVGDLVGARDNLADKTAFAGRARRANANMVEAMVMFAPAVLAAHVSGQSSGLTALGAALFFWGRVAFAPMYWFGVPWVRTVAWAVSVFGILMILWELFL